MRPPSITPQDFVAKWSKSELRERQASQEHFIDLCRMLGHETPAECDAKGTSFAFEAGAEKTGGKQGWADVWKRGFFAWEYKGKHKDLDAAYRQLLQYRESLENPPLLVVSDMERIIIHTNFTNTVKQVLALEFDDLLRPEGRKHLHSVFFEPGAFEKGKSVEQATEVAATKFAALAELLRERDVDPHKAAHFLIRLLFCLFAEDIGLLPKDLFTHLARNTRNNPAAFEGQLRQLFLAMSEGGWFGTTEIPWFNGRLFNNAQVLPLSREAIEVLSELGALDWSAVEPSILGTLFERSLDPAKRSQLGAHYTSKEDILTLVEPVLMAPLRKRWGVIKAEVEGLLQRRAETALRATRTRLHKQTVKLITDFDNDLVQVTVLDPACGSGNFLYVSLKQLLDLEKEVSTFASQRGLGSFLPRVSPTQLRGIEKNTYAHELAQATIWIGYIQWLNENGFGVPRKPVLKPLDAIENKDAILGVADDGTPYEPEWPEATVIVGNPPFLGGKMLRRELGDEYVDQMFSLWKKRVSAEADIVCYWFERARVQVEKGKVSRVGLLATQGIRGGANRKVLKRIKDTGDIFFAESDRNWILDGAAVHVSMVGFDDGTEPIRILDGAAAKKINANLATGSDITEAERLSENKNVCLRPTEKGGAFDLVEAEALSLLAAPSPSGRPNSDVVRPWANADSLVSSRMVTWVVDFGIRANIETAARYEAPFERVRKLVYPQRQSNRDLRLREQWWVHRRTGNDMRAAMEGRARLLATPRVSKHRLFTWLGTEYLADTATYVFGSDEEHLLGLLHSRPHETWARAQGTQLRERESGFRYTPNTCFETFPFPDMTDEQRDAIGSAAAELVALRDRWLNPPEWTREEVLEFPGSVDGPWARYVHDADEQGIGTVRYPRLVQRDEECGAKLKKRTLTNLYNARPTWLDLAHCKLNEAVFGAYGWDRAITDDELLEKLLALNLERAGKGR
jgi:hypothetical protein